MNKKNIIIVVALLVLSNIFTYLVFATKSVELSKQTKEQTIASIEGKSFSADDVYLQWKESGASTSALDSLLENIDSYILEKEYGDQAIVDEKTEEMITQTEEYYKSQGTTLDEQFDKIDTLTREDWEADQRVLAMNEIATLDYVKGIITDEEVEKAYKEDLPAAKTSHILVKVQQDGSETLEDAESRAKSEATQILKDLQNDLKENDDIETVFANYAKDFSQDTDSKDNGGDIGYSNSEDGKYQTAAGKLKVGEYTKEPVKTSYGYSIILKTGEQEKPKLDDEGVKDGYIEELALQRITDFPSYSQYAIIVLRKEYDLKIEDTMINDAYNTKVENTESSVENFEDSLEEE